MPPGGVTDESIAVELELVSDQLTEPTYLAQPPGDDRLFVTEQPGSIRIIRDGALLPTPFLDLTAQVQGGGERGLLGLAFAPDFATSGRFFVHYTNLEGSTRVESYTALPGSDEADPATARLVLAHEQPADNHNGGQIVFGPDGMFYLGLGDGGEGAQDNAQDRSSLLGSVLRLDVSTDSGYAVPGDNPFVGEADVAPEIWHYGLRNPWRFSFSSNPALLIIADVGEHDREEVNAVAAGEGGVNFGWPIMEGTVCFGAATCSQEGLRLPVHEYAQPEGCSITGGYVYEGAAIPELVGRYVYSDYCAGFLRTFVVGPDGSASEHASLAVDSPGFVTSFGEDAAGELYVLTHQGSVFKIVPPG